MFSFVQASFVGSHSILLYRAVAAIILVKPCAQRIYDLAKCAAAVIKIPFTKKVSTGNIKIFIFFIFEIGSTSILSLSFFLLLNGT